MRPLPRWVAIALASVLVPVAVFLALFALVSQLSFFGEEPTHQDRAVLLLVLAVALVLTSFTVLALSRGGRGRARVRAAAWGATAGVGQALVAAVAGGVVAWTILVPLWDSVAGPVAFALGAGASFALPRRTPLTLAVRIGLVAAVVASTAWAGRRTGSDAFLALVLVIPAVGVADLLVAWWGRRRFLALLAVVALLPAAELLSVYRHDERARGQRAAYDRVHPRTPVSTLGHDRIVWRAPVAGGGVAAGPVLAADRIVYAGYDRKIHALSAGDGSELWATAAAVPGDRGLVVAGNVVIAPAGDIVALDARTGDVRWSYAYVGGAGTPIVAGDVVVASGDVRGLVGLELRSGRRIWSRPSSRFATTLAAADGVVAAVATTASGRSRLIAVDPSTGATRWTRRLPLPATALAAAGHRLVVCAGSRRLELDARSGRAVASGGRCGSSLPVLPRLALEARGPHGLAAVDPTDDRELWRVFLPGFAPGGPRAVGSRSVVYVPWKDETTSPVTGGVGAFDAATGGERWRVDLGGGVSARPVLAGDTVVVAGDVDCSTEPCSAAIYALRR
jgi:outer membrane protein assembly factor BamB